MTLSSTWLPIRQEGFVLFWRIDDEKRQQEYCECNSQETQLTADAPRYVS